MCVCVCRPRVLGNNTIYADGGDREADKDRCRIFFLFLFLSGTRFHRVPWSKSPLTRPLFMSSSSLGLPPPTPRPLPALSNLPPARVFPVFFSSSRPSPLLHVAHRLQSRAHAVRPVNNAPGEGERGAYSEKSAAAAQLVSRPCPFLPHTIHIITLAYIIRMCVQLAHATTTYGSPGSVLTAHRHDNNNSSNNNGNNDDSVHALHGGRTRCIKYNTLFSHFRTNVSLPACVLRLRRYRHASACRAPLLLPLPRERVKKKTPKRDESIHTEIRVFRSFCTCGAVSSVKTSVNDQENGKIGVLHERSPALKKEFFVPMQQRG